MTTEQRSKLGQAVKLLAELEIDMGKSLEALLKGDATQTVLMFAAVELGQVMAAKKALGPL